MNVGSDDELGNSDPNVVLETKSDVTVVGGADAGSVVEFIVVSLTIASEVVETGSEECDRTVLPVGIPVCRGASLKAHPSALWSE